MKRRELIKKAAVLGGLATGGPLLAACAPAATAPSPSPSSAPTATASPTPKPIRTLKVGYLPLTDFLGMYAAIEQGYMADEGLKLELQAMAGGATIIPAIVGGSLDFGISNYVSVIVANGQGIKIKAFSDSAYGTKASPPFAIIVKKGSSIKTAKDLNGKKVAVNTRNGIVHVGVMEWIERNGGDPSTVPYVELPFPQMPPAITSGSVDAAAPTEPFVTVSTPSPGSSRPTIGSPRTATPRRRSIARTPRAWIGSRRTTRPPASTPRSTRTSIPPSPLRSISRLSGAHRWSTRSSSGWT